MAKLYLIISALLLLIATQAEAQGKVYSSTNPAYVESIELAEQHYENGELQQAIPHYEAALGITGKSFRSKLRLAICYFSLDSAAAGNKWLDKCAVRNWEWLCDTTDNQYTALLRPYAAQVNWKRHMRTCAKKINALDSNLIRELAEIHRFDQNMRNGSLTDADYDSSDNYWSGMSWSQLDSVNMSRMERIFSTHGYPGKDLVGKDYCTTGWMVVQHADTEVEKQEKYFPLIEAAEKAGQSQRGNSAYLRDRINKNRGVCQVFGTQIYLNKDDNYALWPVKNLAEINQRRAANGLGPIEDYISHWGLVLSDEFECRE